MKFTDPQVSTTYVFVFVTTKSDYSYLFSLVTFNYIILYSPYKYLEIKENVPDFQYIIRNFFLRVDSWIFMNSSLIELFSLILQIILMHNSKLWSRISRSFIDIDRFIDIIYALKIFFFDVMIRLLENLVSSAFYTQKKVLYNILKIR